ncbi:MAG TPA: hypothetical protein PK033_06440 [Acetivibrio sp.]|nr:hypothetical protein [Clostridium sp.]HOQ37497.1 hypothetical protein [Acetivibrio sp.]HQA57500.1 hypothetical protein [Acetivibrio sp.]
MKAKIKALNEKAGKLSSFAKNLDTFYNNIKQTDKDLESKFSSLYGLIDMVKWTSYRIP